MDARLAAVAAGGAAAREHHHEEPGRPGICGSEQGSDTLDREPVSEGDIPDAQQLCCDVLEVPGLPER